MSMSIPNSAVFPDDEPKREWKTVHKDEKVATFSVPGSAGVELEALFAANDKNLRDNLEIQVRKTKEMLDAALDFSTGSPKAVLDAIKCAKEAERFAWGVTYGIRRIAAANAKKQKLRETFSSVRA